MGGREGVGWRRGKAKKSVKTIRSHLRRHHLDEDEGKLQKKLIFSFIEKGSRKKA